MANDLINLFYAIDSTTDVLPYPIVRHNGQSFVRLSDAVENLEPLIALFERRATGQPHFIPEQVFDYRILVNAAEPQHSEFIAENWLAFDPTTDYAPSNQINSWSVLQEVLDLSGLTVFGDEEVKVNADLLRDFGRFEFRLELERRDKIEHLVVRRVWLDSSEPRLQSLFNMLSRRIRYQKTIPPLVLGAALGELQPHLHESVAVYPLREFAGQIKTCLARTVIAHHYIYFRLIKRLLEISGRTSGGQPFHAAGLLTSYLTDSRCVGIDRAELLETIRRIHPQFDFHPVLADVCVSEVELRARFAPTRIVDQETVGGAQRDLIFESTDKQTIVNLTAAANSPELRQYLDYLNCPLCFVNYRFDAAVELGDESLTELAARLAENVEELSGTWTMRPTAQEVDYQVFWRRGKRDYTGDFRAMYFSGVLPVSLRYALYNSPHGGAGDTLQAIIDDELITIIFGDANTRQSFRVFALDTKASSFFINEWWDYLWVAVNPAVGKVIVILGTATD